VRSGAEAADLAAGVRKASLGLMEDRGCVRRLCHAVAASFYMYTGALWGVLQLFRAVDHDGEEAVLSDLGTSSLPETLPSIRE